MFTFNNSGTSIFLNDGDAITINLLLSEYKKNTLYVYFSAKPITKFMKSDKNYQQLPLGTTDNLQQYFFFFFLVFDTLRGENLTRNSSLQCDTV